MFENDTKKFEIVQGLIQNESILEIAKKLPATLQ